MSFFAELKRRNVFKVAVAYLIVGWLLLQVGEVLAPALRLPEWVNSALAFFIILGFPLAILFAWAFEMTPEGLKLEKDVDRTQSITRQTGQKLNYAIIALLVLALGYFAFDKFGVRQHDGPGSAAGTAEGGPGHSIAVLPLADMSPQGDHEYFSDGLTEELLNILAKIKELRVAGRTSSFAFKDRDEDLRDIGRKLSVGHILEGSVRKDDARNRVRITLQLIKVEDGYHLWSETYDRDLDDIFAIQEEVAHEVAKVLRITLLGEDEARLDQIATTDVDAYDLYLQGMHLIHQGGFVQLKEALQRLQESLTLDPDYTPARIGMVNAWTEMANTGAMTPAEAVARGMPLLQTALEEKPNDSPAHVQMAMLHFFGSDTEAADRSFRRSLELDPRNAGALQEYGRFLYNHGEIARGMDLIEAALELEPYNVRILWDRCQTNAQQARPETALPACARIRELEPDSPLGYYGKGLVHMYLGDLPQAMQGYADAIERDPGDFEMIGAMSLFWSDLGDLEQAKDWLTRAQAMGAGQAVPLIAEITTYLLQEQHDRAGKLASDVLARGVPDRHGILGAVRRVAANQGLLRGDHELAAAPYRDLYPWAFDAGLEAPEALVDDVDDLLMVAAVMKRADPLSDRPAALLDLVEPHLDRYYPGWGIWHGDVRRARAETIRGNHELAIGHLRQARDDGAIVRWRFFIQHDPVFRELDAEPEYRDLIAWYEGEMDRQREEAYALLGVTP